MDYTLSSRNKLTFTMSREKDWGVTGQTGQPDFPKGAFGDVKRAPDFYTASWTSTISSSILNEFRFGLKRDTWQGTSPLDKGCCWNGNGQNDLVESSQEMRASFPSIGGQFVYVAPRQQHRCLLAVRRGFAAAVHQSVPTVVGHAELQHGRPFVPGGRRDRLRQFASVQPRRSTNDASVRNAGHRNIPVPNSSTTNFRGIQTNDITTAQNLLASLAGTVTSIQQQYFVNSPTATEWSDYRTDFIFERDLHENDWDLFL